MNAMSTARGQGTFATLRRLAQGRRMLECCELCSVELASDHRHLLEMERQRILCACIPCALRFENVVGGRYKLIPREVRALKDFQLTDLQWESLAIPINLAFFFHNSPKGKIVAMYPSPAGATESLLASESWRSLTAQQNLLLEMAADVEALLVNRTAKPHVYLIVPMDLCFELVGLLRVHWRGLSGGEKVWVEIEKFFERLKAP